MAALPCYYIPHGGGPCFFMEWTLGPADTWHGMAAFLRGLLADLPARPRALLVISAHWEADPVRINSAAAPALIYDYYGFPPHTYQLRYPHRAARNSPHRRRTCCAHPGWRHGWTPTTASIMACSFRPC